MDVNTVLNSHNQLFSPAGLWAYAYSPNTNAEKSDEADFLSTRQSYPDNDGHRHSQHEQVGNGAQHGCGLVYGRTVDTLGDRRERKVPGTGDRATGKYSCEQDGDRGADDNKHDSPDHALEPTLGSKATVQEQKT